MQRVKFITKISRCLIALAIVVGTFVTGSAFGSSLVSAQLSPDEFNSTATCKPGTFKNEDNSPCVTSRDIPVSDANQSSLVDQLLNPFITLMTALVGIIIAISLVAAGVTYSSAGGDPSKVAAAKKRITNSIIAIIAYIFTLGIIQWLVPGGIV